MGFLRLLGVKDLGEFMVLEQEKVNTVFDEFEKIEKVEKVRKRQQKENTKKLNKVRSKVSRERK